MGPLNVTMHVRDVTDRQRGVWIDVSVVAGVEMWDRDRTELTRETDSGCSGGAGGCGVRADACE